MGISPQRAHGELIIVPAVIPYTEEFFLGEECALEVTLKVLYGDPAWEDTTTKEKTELNLFNSISFSQRYIMEQLPSLYRPYALL